MAYVESLRATEGACELLIIAVDPRYQSNGRGAALLRHVEARLVEQGQRLLLVQTSGDDGYARTRFTRGAGTTRQPVCRTTTRSVLIS